MGIKLVAEPSDKNAGEFKMTGDFQLLGMEERKRALMNGLRVA